MKQFITDKRAFTKAYISMLLLIAMLSLPSTSKALIDTTLFRINVVQDSVYAGDTVDVDFYIGGGGLLGILNILNEFEIQVSTDTTLIKQDNIHFHLDTLSLQAFFNTTINNILTITSIDNILGTLNVKGSSSQIGSGNARVGRGKYIVQDNVAGRQYMRYKFDKSISKGLLGLINPVKVMVDSVLIVERLIPTAIKNKNSIDKLVRIYPNPATDFIQLEADKVKSYQLLNIRGDVVLSVNDPAKELIQLDMSKLNAGVYILQVQTEDTVTQYKIIKQ